MDCGGAHLNQLPDNIEGVTQVRFGKKNAFKIKICQPVIDEELDPGATCLLQKAIFGNFGANHNSIAI